MGVFLGDYSIHGKRPSVEEELAKHGSHNQKTHGGKGGGGGGSGGGGATSSNTKDDESKRNDKIVDSISDDVDEVKNALDEYYDDLEDGADDDEVIRKISDSLDAATRKMEQATETKDYDRHTTLMDTAQGHLRDAFVASTYGTGDFQNEFKRTLEVLSDKADDYLGDLENEDD